MKLPCYLVRDLLPLYKDQVCEPDTAAAVKEHLEECSDCRALWEKMQGIDPAEVEMERTKAREQVAALQRVKREQRYRRFRVVLTAVVATVCVVGIALYAFCSYAWTFLDYFDYNENATLKVEYRTGDDAAEEKGIYMVVDADGHNSVICPAYVQTDEGRALFFSLYQCRWCQWFGNHWGDFGILNGDGTCAIRLEDEQFVPEEEPNRVNAVYYLPYQAMETWKDSGSQTLPEEAELMWQRDDAAAPAAP